MLEDVWQYRNFPVLLEVARRADVNPTGLWLPVQEVEQATGLEPDKVQQAGWWLSKAELVAVDARETTIKAFTGITPAARERVGFMANRRRCSRPSHRILGAGGQRCLYA